MKNYLFEYEATHGLQYLIDLGKVSRVEIEKSGGGSALKLYFVHGECLAISNMPTAKVAELQKKYRTILES
jgi:hypothetical protein